MHPGKGKLTSKLPKTGEVRLRSSYIEEEFHYASVIGHELGHALEWNLLGTINKETYKVFGDSLSPEILKKIKDELVAVTKELEGPAVVASRPEYYLRKTELLARFLEKMITSSGNLSEIAPTALDHFEKQAIKHPIIGEFLEATKETIDKGQPKVYILPDLKEMYIKHLGKRVGTMAYQDEVVHKVMQERAKYAIEKFIKEKFKDIKDAPDLLFKAAESIKVTKAGTPEFGTRNFKAAKNPEEERALQEAGWYFAKGITEDGKFLPLYARDRYTPEEAKAFFNKLSPKGQQLIKDFTAQKDEAKDFFNRELIKDAYKVEGNIEGWVHHYWEEGKIKKIEEEGKVLYAIVDKKGNIIGGKYENLDDAKRAAGIKEYYRMGRKRIKEKKAGTRFTRTGEEGFVEDLKKAMHKVLVDLEGEKAYNNFIQKWFARVTKPILEGHDPDPGWTDVVGTTKKGIGTAQEKKLIIVDKETGKTFVPKQTQYQMPTNIYKQYKLIKDLQEEATMVVKVVNDLNRYWRVNVLFHPGSASTNFISGGLQYAAKIMTDFYTEVLTGKVKMPQTRKNISAMLKVLSPKGWMEAEDWIYGGDLSNFYGQFTEKPGISKPVDAYADKALKLYGAVERYWKKVILLSENVSDLNRLKKVTPEGLAVPTKEESQMLADLNDSVDLYAYDYNNVPIELEAFNRNPIAVGIKPFMKYPYKYMKQILNMAGAAFDGTLPWQERLAKIMALATLASTYAYIRNEQKKKQKTPEGVPETPAYVSPRGRLYTGEDESGKEMFVRTAKYPFMNLTEAGMQAAEGNWEAAKDQLSDILGSIGPVGQVALLACDYRSKYNMYDNVPSIIGDSIATFIPGYRILNDISRLNDPFQRKQENFWQSFTKIIPTTDADLQEKFHGKIRTIRVPTEGKIGGATGKRTTIDREVLNFKDDILLSLLTGIYRKRIDPDEAEAFQIRKEKNTAKKEAKLTGPSAPQGLRLVPE